MILEKSIVSAVTSVLAVAGIGWGSYQYLDDRFAKKADIAYVFVVESKSDLSIQELISYWSVEKGKLEAKCRDSCTPFELARIQEMERKIEKLQKIQTMR